MSKKPTPRPSVVSLSIPVSDLRALSTCLSCAAAQYREHALRTNSASSLLKAEKAEELLRRLSIVEEKIG